MMPWTVYLGPALRRLFKNGILPRRPAVLPGLGRVHLPLFLPLEDAARHLYRPHVPADGLSHRLVLVSVLY